MTADTENTRPPYAAGNVMYGIRDAVKVNVWLTGDAAEDERRLHESLDATLRWLNGMPDDIRADVMYVTPRASGGGYGGRGSSRADRFPLIDGMKCDKCDGPVGRKARTGGMRNDAAICLGSCKEPGRDGKEFAYTVGWLNEDGTLQGGGNRRRDDAPDQGRAAPPALPADRPTTGEKKKERTIGDFLTWCRKEHGLNRQAVLEILDVKDSKEIADLSAATSKVKAHVAAGEKARQ